MKSENGLESDEERLVRLDFRAALLWLNASENEYGNEWSNDHQQARYRWACMTATACPKYTRNAIVHNGILDPGTSLLTKPFRVEELAEKIRRVIDTQFRFWPFVTPTLAAILIGGAAVLYKLDNAQGNRTNQVVAAKTASD